jgi:hypothetical protein
MATLFSNHLRSSMILILPISSRVGVAVIFLVLLTYFIIRLLMVMLLLLALMGFSTICTPMILLPSLWRLSGAGLGLKRQHKKLLPLLAYERWISTGNHHLQLLLKRLGTGSMVESSTISLLWYRT